MSGLETIVVNNLGMKIKIFDNLQENQYTSIKIYLIINLIFWSINHIMVKNEKHN